MSRNKILTLLLRFDALVLTTAFVAVFLTTDFMARSHAAMGLGELPRRPLVDYLTRSLALMYGARGLFVWLAASDIERYRPFVRLIGVTNALLGVALFVIDLHAGMPPLWTACEGPPILVFGLVILWLANDRS